MKTLIKGGADVDYKKVFGSDNALTAGTALWNAAFRSHLEVVRILIEAGSDVNIADYFDQQFQK